MAVRGLRLIPVEQWLGLDQFTDPQETPANVWTDSLNIVVLPNGNPTALRSPANFNTALSTGNKVISGADYERSAGSEIIFDINSSTGSHVATYRTTGSSNTLVRFSQADAAWQSINANDCLYRVNGTEFIQIVTSFDVYPVGITAPASAPSVSLVSGGAGSLTTGCYLSYAYYNAGTTHFGQCSDPSGITGSTSGGSNTIQITTTASAETGVTNIVIFISQDGGTVRYLLTDANGDPQYFANTTGSQTVSVDAIYRNLNVEETAFNAPPPTGITFISKWKNRIIGVLGRFFQYSGFDQIAAGIPQEAWPPLNVLTIPSKGETAKGGIETPQGWLGFSEKNAYLISGEPTDKVDSGENVLQITESLDQTGWALGTRSPKAIVNTPYGTLWFDQNKHLQLWQNWEGAPTPIALGIWPDLASIQDTDAAMAMAEATWFPAGGANGGFYALTASTSGSTNNRCWFVMMIRTSSGLIIAPAPSSIAAQCVFTARINGELRCFIGVTDRLREILDFDTAGAGWSSADQLYFSSVVGNDASNFNRLHMLRLAGQNAKDASVTVSNLDGSLSETLYLWQEDGDYLANVDRGNQPRHKVTVKWPNDDVQAHNVQNLRYGVKSERRAL